MKWLGHGCLRSARESSIDLAGSWSKTILDEYVLDNEWEFSVSFTHTCLWASQFYSF